MKYYPIQNNPIQTAHYSPPPTMGDLQKLSHLETINSFALLKLQNLLHKNLQCCQVVQVCAKQLEKQKYLLWKCFVQRQVSKHYGLELKIKLSFRHNPSSCAEYHSLSRLITNFYARFFYLSGLRVLKFPQKDLSQVDKD